MASVATVVLQGRQAEAVVGVVEVAVLEVEAVEVEEEGTKVVGMEMVWEAEEEVEGRRSS